MKEKIISAFENDDGFVKAHGIKITKLENDEAIMECDLVGSGCNVYGIAHGGMLFGIADACAGALACMSGKYPLTINASINYLNKADCKRLIAKASIIKLGKTIGYYKVDVFNENNLLLCTCNVNMFLKESK